MGQSILRDRKTPFRSGGQCRLFNSIKKCFARILSKGNRVNIPEPGHGDCPLGGYCGNANEPGDAGGSPGKSSLFFVRDGLPGIGLPGDRDVVAVKHRASRGVRCTPVGP